ncbi:MAG: acyl-CoA dehydrogenase family protein [Pseudomonadales bacterium]
MNFDLSEEQQLLQQSVERFVTENYDLATRRKLVDSPQGYSDENWSLMAELGWLALPFEESDGGFGGNQIDTMIVMEQFGRGLVVEPYFANIVVGGGMLKRSSNHALKTSLLPGIISGDVRLTLAHAEEQSRFDLDDVVTSAREDGDHYVLNGKKSMVPNAATATHVIVSARTGGGQQDKNGIALFLIDSGDLDGNHFPTVDGGRASELTLENVRVPAERIIGDFNLLAKAAHDGVLALSAEASGCMEVLYKSTVDYTQEREQFGHPLSDFQVLQHRMVDMFMEYEQCKSLLYRATLEAVQDAPTAVRTSHALKHLVGKSAAFIGENAVQLHGGMGMTEELAVGHYFKRLLVIESQFGDTDYHLAQFAA